MEHFQFDPLSILHAPKESLNQWAGESLAEKIVSLSSGKILSSLIPSLEKNRIRVLLRTSKEYPNILKEIYDPPLVLYAKGKPLSEEFWGLSIVGSRHATEYGKNLSFHYSHILSSLGIPVISGLARGIDTQAHRGAFKERGGTVAVLGSGLNVIYPSENLDLSENIAQNGTLLSEFPPGTQPLSPHFPVRNRIISGLSKGVLVIEASKESGSLITASLALEQNRSVMAIPGKPKDKLSEGCNRLIQMGAKLVLSEEDILEELGLNPVVLNNKKELLLDSGLSESEKKVLGCLNSDEPCHVDMIKTTCTDISSQQISYLLLKLEMKKLIRRLAGDYLLLNKRS